MSSTLREMVSALLVLLAVAGCTSSSKPAILFMVAGDNQLGEEQELVWVERGEDRLRGARDFELIAGDRVVADEGVDGVGMRTLQTISTAMGPASLALNERFLAQETGSVLHEAESAGTLILPGYTARHEEKSSYLVTIEDQAITFTIFAGAVTVSSVDNAFPPFNAEAGNQRRVWITDQRISPSRPLRPSEINIPISQANRLLEIGESKTRLVPIVLDLPHEDGTQFIKAFGFDYEVKYGQDETGTMRLGHVYEQSPFGGHRLALNRNALAIVKGTPVIVPNVLGMRPARAIRILDRSGMGYKLLEVGEITGNFKVGVINEQSPAGGSDDTQGNVVVLTKEAPSVKVPNLIGSTYTIADRKLARLPLKANVGVRSFDEEHRGENVVIRQSLSAGLNVAPRDPITLDVKVRGYPVPMLVGKTEGAAVQELIGAGGNFSVGKLERVHSSSPVGKVTAQFPIEGTLLGMGDPVRLIISKGPEPAPTEPIS